MQTIRQCVALGKLKLKYKGEFRRKMDVEIFKKLMDYGFQDDRDFSYDKYKEYNPLSENVSFILESRYLMNRYSKDEEKVVKEKSFYELCRRCSRLIASGETLYTKDIYRIRLIEHNIFEDMINRRFMFNSPALFNLGIDMIVNPELSELIYDLDNIEYEDYKKLFDNRSQSQMCFACFVIPVDDSLDGIYSSVKNAALISMKGGGVGTNFGRTRESGSDIRHGMGGKATGPLGWMRQWETMAEVVVQGGRRRAALMGMMDVNHPDIEEFIKAKDEDGVLSYFNLSVSITDEFMDAVINDKPFVLRSRNDPSKDKEINARELWDKICEHAWKRGDPGIHFIDTSNQDSLLKLNKNWVIEATNPCGEMNLPFKVDNTHYNPFTTSNIGVEPREYPIYESEFSEGGTSCNLGSLNLVEFVETNEDGSKIFNFDKFTKQIHRSIYYLDLVIDVSEYPLKGIEVNTKAIRPVGMGLMGIHDVALLMNLEFKTVDGELFGILCNDIAKHMAFESLLASVDIVNKLGKEPFSENACVKDLFDEYMKDVPNYTSSDLYIKLLADENGIFIPRSIRNALLALSEYNSDEYNYVANSLMKGKIRNSRRQSIAPCGCSVKETLVNTGSGLLMLEELGDINSKRVWSDITQWVEQEDTSTLSDKFYINGYANTKKITLSSGLILESTYNHQYRIYDKHNEYTWMMTEGLKIGDRVVYKIGSCNNNFNRFEDYKELDQKYYIDRIKEYIDELNIDFNKDKHLHIRLRTMGRDDAIVYFNYILFNNKERSITISNGNIARELLTLIRYNGLDGKITYNDNAYKVTLFTEEEIENSINKLLNSELLRYDTVVKIENSTNYTYDIQVPEKHTYIANSYISHNTISLICDASSGIEPNFTYEWDRRINTIDENGNTVPVTKHYVQLQELHDNGSINDPVWKTALEIDPSEHVGIVSIFAKYIDTSISKTINLPNSATVDDIKKVYMGCYKNGIKGITIYRDGSRSFQPITATNKKDKETENTEEHKCSGNCKCGLEKTMKKASPEQLIEIFKNDASIFNKFFSSFVESGRSAEIIPYDEEDSTYEKNPSTGVGSFINIKSPYGTIYFSAKFDIRDRMREVFITLNKSGQELKAITEALSRLVSIILQESIDYKSAYRRMCKTLKGIGGFEAFVYDGERTKKEYIVKSIPDLLSYVLPDLEYIYLLNKYDDPEIAVSNMLSKIPDEELTLEEDDETSDEDSLIEDQNEEYIKRYNNNKGLVCPECGGTNFYMSDGCNRCLSCGHSKCSIS